jgi:hypothetical protein
MASENWPSAGTMSGCFTNQSEELLEVKSLAQRCRAALGKPVKLNPIVCGALAWTVSMITL